MVCNRGRASPNTQTKLRLFSDAAGYCQRVACRTRLFSDEGGDDYHFAEMAHVVAAADDGPRGDQNTSIADRGAYENLVLLCPNCHTKIDKSPDTFPDEMIREWKKNHKEAIQAAIGVAKFSNRQDARSFIEPFFRQNLAIFKDYGPDNAHRDNPEAEEARYWQRKMLSQIIPNNQSVLLALDANAHLLTPEELATVEHFRQHVEDLIERHLGDNKTAASRFPRAMDLILSDEG